MDPPLFVGRAPFWVQPFAFAAAILGAVCVLHSPVRGACLPDPAPSGGIVSCTGADANGFNAGAATGLTLTVDPGASVLNSGGSPALNLTSGNTVTAAGSVTSTVDALRFTGSNSLQVLSGGTIVSARIAVSASGAGNAIVNSGSITTSGATGDDGIRLSANGNSATNGAGGTIAAVQDGIDARSGTALILQQLVSSGVITAGQAGIRAIDFNSVANAGAIVAGSDGIVLRTGNRIDNRAGATLNSGRIGISLSGSGNVVTNNGSITTSGATGDDGIRSSVNDLTVTNGATGRIDARLDGIDARSGTAAALPQQFLNSGVITAGQVGIRAIDFTAVTNAGGIAAGSDGIVLRAGNRVENQAGGTLMSGRIGVSLSGAGNTILNEGSITTAGALGDDGIRATVNDNSFTNASGGTISAVQDGIDARSGTAALPQQITNAGTIAAGQVGIRAIDFNAVTHSGTIAAGLDGIVLRTGNRVDLQSGSSLTSGRIGLSLSGSGNTILNEGAVATGGTLADDGIRATANDNGIANGAGGTITATQDGIDARSGTAANLQTLTNDGQIVAGQDGIRTQNFNRLTNTGRIAAGLDAVEIRADSVVVNATGGSLEAGRIGISVLGAGTSILNDGAIATSGPVGDDGIRATADRLTITNDGTISARIDGIEARSGTVAAHQQLRNGGTITAGQDGIRAVDFTDVTNDGSVTAGQDGIELRSNGAIVNGSAATIAATGNGARLTGSNSTILNLGLIASSTAAGVAITGGATNVVTNEGTIAGATFSVLGGNGADLVTSSGAFEGDVSLGNGADRLTLQDGALLDGAADGGAGVDAIVLDGSGTYAGAITRFETLSKTGAGAWRLTGGPSSVSATTIAAGELAIDGTLSTSMTVLPGGTLSGSGIIVGDVTSGGGTVSPGSPTGRLTVSGNYASDANSTFRAAIDDAGGGSLSVAGTALLDGRLEIDPMPGDYSGGQVYDLLVAAGGVTGQFALVLVTQPLDFVLAYLADRVRLTTLRSDFTALAETPNQRAVAAYLDDINPPPGSDLETVFVELSTIPADELPDALDQLHPELYQAFDTASFASTRTLLGAADDRIALLGREAYGQTAAALDRIAFAAPISDVPMDPWSATAAAGAAWITASGGAIDQDDSGDHLGYDARSFDLVAGADAPLGHGLHAGIAFALSDTWIDFEDRGSSGEARGLAGALYLAHLDPRLRIAASLGYGHDWNESERVIQFGAIDRVAQADAGSDRFFGSVNGAYALLRQDGWTADAIADLSAIRLASEDFEETGAGSLSLSVEDRTRSSVRSEIGLAVARTVALSDDRSATPHLTIGWAHEFLDEGAEITSAFSGLGSTFAVEGADEPRDRLLIGAGVRLEQSNGAVLSLGYEGEIAADRVESSVRLSLAIRL